MLTSALNKVVSDKKLLTYLKYLATIDTLIGLGFRFYSESHLWLDEALTVNISALPVSQIPNALKHDGAPPLFYYLLHYWMTLVGMTDFDLRILPGLFSVATIPVIYLCGKKIGRTKVESEFFGLAALIVFDLSPFAIYYSKI